MENRKRNIQMKFYVTEEEKRLIDEKMKQLPIKQYGAYFRKMAIDGYILVVDRSDTKAYIRELQAVSRNINQIAKRANATGTVYRQDIEDIKKAVDEISRAAPFPTLTYRAIVFWVTSSCKVSTPFPVKCGYAHSPPYKS